MATLYRVAVEELEPDQWIAHVIDLSGCFSAASSEAGAVDGVSDAIAGYYEWVSRHDGTLPVVAGSYQVEVVERVPAVASEEVPGYIINAFFNSDRPPLTYWDVVGGLRLLDWTRAALKETVAAVDDSQWHAPIKGEHFGSIAGILDHIAEAENWYLDRLNHALDQDRLPADPWERLKVVRAHMQRQLIAFIGDTRITERRGELWSPRKVLRRAVWHEQDHTQHIAQLLAEHQGT